MPFAADYSENFAAHQICGFALLQLTAPDLVQLGVTQPAHRALIINLRNDLLAASSWTPAQVAQALSLGCEDWVEESELIDITSKFTSVGVNGCRLLRTDDTDLVNMGVTKMGLVSSAPLVLCIPAQIKSVNRV